MHKPVIHMQRRSDQIPSSVDLSSAWNYESVSVIICVNYAGSQLCEMVCSWCRSCSHQCQPQCVESIHCTSGLLPNPYSSRGASLINDIHDCWNVNYEQPIALQGSGYGYIKDQLQWSVQQSLLQLINGPKSPNVL